MRVFHLVKGLGRGGAETLLARTASTQPLTARRNAYGYFLPWKDALVQEIREQGCVVKCFSAKNPGEMLLRLPELILFLKSWRPDIIHGHLPLAGVMARLAGKALGVPVVYTEHNLQERYHPITRFANRLTWGMQQRVVAVSGEVSESIARSLSEKPLVEIILNGVDCGKFCPNPQLRSRARAELGLTEDDFLVGSVAVFRKQKRLDLWLDVARRLAAELPAMKYALVGDGPERPLVDRLVAEYGLQSRIRLPGLQADVQPYYAAMDAFFMSSDFEGLPVALLEAMASGVPAVVTQAGGIGEVITNSSVGLLAPIGDVGSLATYLRTLYSDRAAARAMGRIGRKRVQDSFSLTMMSLQLEELYAEAAGLKTVAFRPTELEGYRFERDIRVCEAVELIRLALGKGSERSPRTQEFFQWKHENNPFGVSYSLGARDLKDGRLAGLRLFQRWQLASDRDRFSAVRGVDTSTHPQHQRRGVFTALTRNALADLAEEGVALVFNTPNKQSLPGYLKMGWELVARVPVKAKFLSGGSGPASFAGQTLEELVRHHQATSIESLVRASRLPGRLQIDKSLEYLRWRYARHPAMSYRFAAQTQAGQVTCLIVWCETERNRLREFVLCELFAESVDEATTLLREALRAGRCHYAVSAFLNHPKAEAILQQLGFRNMPLKSIALAVNPLTAEGKQAVNEEKWVFSTGDLQVF